MKPNLLMLASFEVLKLFCLDSFDESIAFEIFGVECQQTLNVMSFHRGDDFSETSFRESFMKSFLSPKTLIISIQTTLPSGKSSG